jgi:N-methylhydantoinase B/oxoprolinase/acetone carboxylase alpha subunit
VSRRPDARAAAELGVFRHLFASVAEEMGVALRLSSVSPNIKERRDYSCALLDAEGRLVAHAAHIPVHLGSAHLTVPAVLAELDPGPGDVIVLNDPHRGGTHLNDVTVVAPVFAGRRRLGFLLDRAHHADVGGAEPGSLAGATDLYGEGLILPPVHLVRRGAPVEEVWKLFLANTREAEARRADLQAQLAALHRGAERFAELVERFGVSGVARGMEGLVEHGARMTAALLRGWPEGEARAVDHLDGADTPRIAVSVRNRRGRLRVDFSGSSDQVAGSWNTHRAVVSSALFYVLQALAPEELPESSGVLQQVDLLLPEASVVSSSFPAGVAAGNVETSQRITDVLLAALAGLVGERVPAASQGTMNNWTCGGRRPEGGEWVYYETVGGGAGAGPRGDGASAVQVHMTNTRNTPVEVLEAELPLRVRRLELRRGSGGRGLHRGGDGLLKEVEFLVPARVSVIATRRRTSPAGSAGGGDGRPGRDTVVLAGRRRRVRAGETLELRPGDRLVLATPGGGGWGLA